MSEVASVVVMVCGVPSGIAKEELQDLAGDIGRLVAKSGASVDAEKIKFFFSDNLVASESEKRDVCASVDGLAVAECARPEDVRNKLAQQIGWTLKLRFPEASVQCAVHPADRSSTGYWKSNGD
jgi:hypothetical protein